jgi:hypothetical protein
MEHPSASIMPTIAVQAMSVVSLAEYAAARRAAEPAMLVGGACA